jgi:hypothetical protein
LHLHETKGGVLLSFLKHSFFTIWQMKCQGDLPKNPRRLPPAPKAGFSEAISNLFPQGENPRRPFRRPTGGQRCTENRQRPAPPTGFASRR